MCSTTEGSSRMPAVSLSEMIEAVPALMEGWIKWCELNFCSKELPSGTSLLKLLKGAKLTKLLVDVIKCTGDEAGHAAKHCADLLGGTDAFQYVTILSICSAAEHLPIVMQFPGQFNKLQKLCLSGSYISREALAAFGQTCPHLSSMEVSSHLECNTALSLHQILPALTHLKATREAGALFSHSCFEMLGCHSLTSVDIGFPINADIWHVLPNALQHLSCSASSLSPDMHGATAEKPCLRSFTATSKDCISAAGLEQLLRLSASLCHITLIQHDPDQLGETLPISHSIVHVYAEYKAGDPDQFNSFSYINKQVLEGALEISPDGLHMQMLCTSWWHDPEYLHSMLDSVAPFPAVTGMTLDITEYRGFDSLPHNLHLMFPNITVFNLLAAPPLNRSMVAQLSKCTTLRRIMFDRVVIEHSIADLGMLCQRLPFLDVLELRKELLYESVSKLHDLFVIWEIPTQIKWLDVLGEDGGIDETENDTENEQGEEGLGEDELGEDGLGIDAHIDAMLDFDGLAVF